jgi:hypothetical protein
LHFVEHASAFVSVDVANCVPAAVKSFLNTKIGVWPGHDAVEAETLVAIQFDITNKNVRIAGAAAG